MIQKPQTFTYKKFFWYIFRFAGKRKWVWGVLTLLTLVIAVASLADPLLLQWFIDSVLVSGKTQLLVPIIAVFAGLKMLSLVLTYIHGVGYASFTQKTFFELRADLYEHLQHKEIGFFSQKEVGDLMRTLLTDVQTLQQIFSTFEGVISNSFRLLVILIIVYIFDWRLFVIALILIPLFAAVQFLYLQRLHLQAEKQTQADVNLSTFFEQRLSNIMLVKLFSQESNEAEIGRQLSERYARENVRFVALVLLLTTTIAFISNAALIALLWVGAVSVMKGLLTIGGLIAVYSYLARIFGPIGMLASVPGSLQMSLISGERMYYALNAPEEDHKRGWPLEDVKGRITFEHVTFSYPTSKRPVLKDCSFEIAPGETVGIVGASGAGKTTITKLLLRFIEPQKGEITIDHKSIADVWRVSLRNNIGVVPQANLFLPGTIFDNLVYATPTATQADVERAARAAGIHDAIWKLPDGYKTMIGPDGSPFSEGERQRLSIARVLLKDPKIFVFDEPTAELDAEAEALVKQTIKNISKNRTAIIIAHRFASLDLVDRILVLKNGSVIEQGTFHDLLKQKGEFARLYKLQKHHHDHADHATK